MTHLNKFKRSCKVFAGCFGGAAAVFSLLAATVYGQYMSDLSRSLEYSRLYSTPDPSNFQLLLGVSGICVVGTTVAVVALVAANLLIAYRSDVLASQGCGDGQES